MQRARFRSVNVVGEGGAVCDAMPTYARGSNALTFPNVVSRDHGRRSEYGTWYGILRATVSLQLHFLALNLSYSKDILSSEDLLLLIYTVFFTREIF